MLTTSLRLIDSHRDTKAKMYCHDRQCTYNVTLRRVRIATVVVEKQYVLNESVPSLSYSAYKSHPFCAELYYHLLSI